MNGPSFGRDRIIGESGAGETKRRGLSSGKMAETKKAETKTEEKKPAAEEGGAASRPSTAASTATTSGGSGNVDKKALKENFEAFAKFGDKSADGKTIKLSQSDKWFKQAKMIDGKKGIITTTDTGIAFKKISKNSPKLSFTDWNKYLDEIAKSKSMEVDTLKEKLVTSGAPGFTGATKTANSNVLDRLTDTSKYGGAHKQRFDSSGKGKGKEGRTDPKPATFRSNSTSSQSNDKSKEKEK